MLIDDDVRGRQREDNFPTIDRAALVMGLFLVGLSLDMVMIVKRAPNV